LSSLDRTLDGRSESLFTFAGAHYDAFIAGRQAVWPENGRWQTRSILTEPPWIGPASTLAADGRHARTCRAPRGTAVVVSPEYAWNEGERATDVLGGHVVFLEREGRFAPATTIPRGPSTIGRDGRESLGPLTLACSDDRARIATSRITWGEDLIESAEIIRWLCDGDRCTEQRASLGRIDPVLKFMGGNATSRPDDMEAPLVIDLGARTLVMWRSHGAIWARLAPFADLGQATDRVITGSDGPRVVAFADDGVMTRDRVAIVFLSVREGEREATLTLRADADGELRVLSPVP
jgi:hypothetical protein